MRIAQEMVSLYVGCLCTLASGYHLVPAIVDGPGGWLLAGLAALGAVLAVVNGVRAGARALPIIGFLLIWGVVTVGFFGGLFWLVGGM
jgi:hypothetical protein